MSAVRTETQQSSHARTKPGESLDDGVLARLVQQGIRDLARHSGDYAAVFANKPGARLAHHVAVGHVAELSESGRVALADLYRLSQTALTVEPGPRHEHVRGPSHWTQRPAPGSHVLNRRVLGARWSTPTSVPGSVRGVGRAGRAHGDAP